MNCPHCGTSNLDNASLCINCGRPMNAAAPPPPRPVTQSYTPPPPPPNTFMDPPPAAPGPGGQPPPPGIAGTFVYLLTTLVTVLCCCNPFSLVTIVFAANTISRRGAGDYAGMARNARLTAIWFWIAAAITVLGWGLAVGVRGWDIFEEIRRNLPR